MWDAMPKLRGCTVERTIATADVLASVSSWSLLVGHSYLGPEAVAVVLCPPSTSAPRRAPPAPPQQPVRRTSLFFAVEAVEADPHRFFTKRPEGCGSHTFILQHIIYINDPTWHLSIC